MGDYGYKFAGNAGFAAQCYQRADKSLSSKQEPISESSDTRRDGRPPMSDNCGQHREKVSSRENNIADCLSKLVIAFANYRKKYIDKDR